MKAIDTNIFIFAHFEEFKQHEKARTFCKNLAKDSDWCIAWQVYYEYLRITTHPSILKKPLTVAEAIEDLKPYFELDNFYVLTETPKHKETTEMIFKSFPSAKGNIIHDCHYATLLKEHGIATIYTADTDFKKFDFIKVVDPTL
jgi:toxin-antitoxin system PIN domain toxin